MFSKACEYAIKATLHIAHSSNRDEKCSLKNIAEAIASPEAFTAKILQSLAKNNIIISIKGANGGYVLDNKKQKTTTLMQIVTAVDGDKIYNGCGLGLHQCNEDKPCPIHNEFKLIRNNLKEMLQNTTIAKLSSELSEGNSFLKI
ncbi:Rrf2 family transcriptional regulator [Wenyingzhuangia fucanilytica]|uniref:Rrf2 family transcriptional regulator n=1 Tax=Wenyingzhuangia fucanilytica TaxID=1790137 RepID=A0A1B1Y268_9FLAO|nr:Rrf2 family transcriptional regulator [Wenyingzhuangia fucanilytica]ANW94866.1 Rrf2 family transcriptional regulator [Wenyingzhuangia fucanilytica]